MENKRLLKKFLGFALVLVLGLFLFGCDNALSIDSEDTMDNDDVLSIDSEDING